MENPSKKIAELIISNDNSYPGEKNEMSYLIFIYFCLMYSFSIESYVLHGCTIFLGS